MSESVEELSNSGEDEVSSKLSSTIEEQVLRRRQLLEQSAANEADLNDEQYVLEIRRLERQRSMRSSCQNQYLFNSSMILQRQNEDLEKTNIQNSRMKKSNLEMMKFEDRIREKELEHQEQLERYNQQLAQNLQLKRQENALQTDTYETDLRRNRQEVLQEEEFNDRFHNALALKSEMRLADLDTKQLALKNEMIEARNRRMSDQRAMEIRQKDRSREYFNEMERYNESVNRNMETRGQLRANQMIKENNIHLDHRHDMNMAEQNRVDNLVTAKKELDLNEIEKTRRLKDMEVRAEEDKQAAIRNTIREWDDVTSNLKSGENNPFGQFLKGCTGCFVFIVLDESGSMSGTGVLDGLNRFIERQKNNGRDTTIMILKFNSRSNLMVQKQSISTMQTLTSHHYRPNSSTALYDAIIEGVAKCKQARTSNEQVYFAIFTDGADCASRHSAEQAKNAMKSMNDWAFLYIGINPEKWSQLMEMNKKYCIDFDTTSPASNFDRLHDFLEMGWKIFLQIQQSVKNLINRN